MCPPLSTLAVNGSCVCQSGSFFNINTLKCEAEINCTAGFYNNGKNTCLPCTTNCNNCLKNSGVCSSCIAPYSVLLNGTCGCKPNTYYNKATNKCDDEVTCAAGFYHNGVINTCQPCGTNCTSCEKITAKCKTCAANNIIDTTNPK